MKKLIFILGISFFLSTVMFSQLNGSGTSSNPYYGTIIQNTTWTGDEIWANDIEITAGFTLTISPGEFTGSFLNMEGHTLTIDAGGIFIINPQASVTVTSIINNGILTMNSTPDEVGVASLIHDNYAGSGSAQIRLYLSGGTTSGGSYKWHYISVPFDGVITASSFNTQNLVQYIESLATSTDNYPGWVAFDGYQYSSGNTLTNTFNTLALGKGYNYYSPAGSTFTLSGAINTASMNVDVPSSGASAFHGYNLIGNPFSSCIDWGIISASGLTGVNDAIYFTNNGSIASYVNGIGANGGTEFIPPLQGFFVKSTASNGRVVLSNTARTHNQDQMRYKKSLEGSAYDPDTISFVRIKLENSEVSSDLVIRFNQKATMSVDKLFDAYEMNKTAGDINIWTTTSGADYSINGLPFPETTMEIPIGVNLKGTGRLKMSSNELNKLDNYTVTLKDILTHSSVNLNKGEFLEFTAPEGIIENRFFITVTNTLTSIPEVAPVNKKFKIYSSNGIISIQALTDEFRNSVGSVTIYDLTGRTTLQQNNAEWQNIGDVIRVKFNPAIKGIYLLEVKTGNTRYVGKLALL